MLRSLVSVIVLVAAGCSGFPIPPDLKGPLYSQTRLTAQGGDIAFFNPTDEGGKSLPPGGKFWLVKITEEQFTIRDAAGKTYDVPALPGTAWSTSVGTWMPKFFGPAAPNVPAAIQADLGSGATRPGMTKEAVALVAGWPTEIGMSRPCLNVPKETILAEDVWLYRLTWDEASTTRTLKFKDGKLTAP